MWFSKSVRTYVSWGPPGKPSTSVTPSSIGASGWSLINSSAVVRGSSTTTCCYHCLQADVVSLRRWGASSSLSSLLPNTFPIVRPKARPRPLVLTIICIIIILFFIFNGPHFNKWFQSFFITYKFVSYKNNWIENYK